MNLPYLQNLHTHSTFDDGSDTPEEMLLHAISLGFDSIGFSGHAYASYGTRFCMSPENTLRFIDEINRLKHVYADRIRVFLGLECDMYSVGDLTPFDYALGSCHYLKIDGNIVGIDRKYDEVKLAADTYFGGDFYKLAACYYEQASHLPEYGHFDVLAHFDLIAKNREKGEMFDIDSPAYRRCALDALHELAKKIPLFEVNTGAIARGYRTSPYPDPFILKAMKEEGMKPLISSDCHTKELLLCGFEQALEAIKSAGFHELYYLTEDGFKGMKI